MKKSVCGPDEVQRGSEPPAYQIALADLNNSMESPNSMQNGNNRQPKVEEYDEAESLMAFSDSKIAFKSKMCKILQDR